jgi:hypothetical protein
MGFSKKKTKTPKNEVQDREIIKKMKVVCTWRFGLRLDIGEVADVIS